jgi:hypothetical protein
MGDAIRIELEPGSATSASHLIYIPERYAGTTRIACDGTEVVASRDASTGLVEVPCRGVVELSPRL